MKGGNSAHPWGLGVGCIILIILAQNVTEYLEEVLAAMSNTKFSIQIPVPGTNGEMQQRREGGGGGGLEEGAWVTVVMMDKLCFTQDAGRRK